MISYSDPTRVLRRMPADAYRDGDRYVLSVELPGVDPASIDVDVDGQVLTVRAQRTAPATDGEKVAWITRERWAGTVERRFSLGRQVDTTGISASSTNGVLTVVLPVAEAAKPRKVEVQAAQAEVATA